MNLICFSHAGALSDPYRALRQHLNTGIALFPVVSGIHTRTGTDADDFLRRLLRHNAKAFAGPTVFLGHSAGGHLAMRAAAMAPATTDVRAVFVSSSASLDCTLGQRPRSDDSDGALMSFMTRLGKTDPALFSYPEARGLVLSVLRRDLALMESQSDLPARSLNAPVHEFWGADEPETIAAPFWSRTSRAGHSLRIFRGGHFHLYDRFGALAQLVNDAFHFSSPLLEKDVLR